MKRMAQPLVLASQSPRRKELLEVLGIPFTVVVSTADETVQPGELPEAYVARVARAKGLEVASRVSNSLLLAADTVVTIDNDILGKPVDRSDAIRMLEKLAGREHSVYTAICLIDQRTGKRREGVDRTRVWLDPITREQILDYIDREDVMDKAGAYAIQGFASVYIPKIEGSYSNVMGLPLAMVWNLLSGLRS
jgi:septum formation protein